MAINTNRKQIREAAMDDLGLFIPNVTATLVDTGNKQITVPRLADISPNPEWLRDCYVTVAAVNDTRRVTNAAALPVLTLSDNIPTLGEGNPVTLYFLLSPEECNRVIDRTLTSELHSPTRYAVALAANTNEYPMPDDLQSRADILGVHWRDTSGNTPREDEVASIRWIETANGLTAHLPHLPVAVTNVSLIVVYKKRYTALGVDTSVTTCPFDLAWRAAEVQILNKLDNKFGPTMRQKFSTSWARADRELTKLKNLHMPPLVARDFTWDREWDFIDITAEILDGSW